MWRWRGREEKKTTPVAGKGKSVALLLSVCVADFSSTLTALSRFSCALIADYSAWENSN